MIGGPWPELRLVVGARGRGATRLDFVASDRHDPPIGALVAVAREAVGALTLAGGEPTLRSDLPALIAALAGSPRLGIATDGLALGDPRVVRPLRGLGLVRVRIALHAARVDAHDWLVGVPGAGRRVVQAIRACADAGLVVEGEIVVTRPTTSGLAETVELLARAGASGVLLRRPIRRGAAAADWIALSPRLGLLEPYLEAAVVTADRRGVSAWIEGFPRCAAPRVADRVLPEGAVRHAAPAGWDVAAEAILTRCAVCPGPPACGGVARDYTDSFGWSELPSAVPPDAPAAPERSPSHRAGTALGLGAVPPPPPRGTRAPATRLRAAVASSRIELAGDPLRVVAGGPAPATVRVSWGAPSRVACPACGDAGVHEVEPTRPVRQRLVAAAQLGAATLHLSGAGLLAHPEAPALLREATRLSFERVEVVGEGSALADWSDAEHRRLRGLTRVEVALYGPDARSHDAHTGRPGSFDAALAGAARVARLAQVATGAVAILHHAEEFSAFGEAWAAGVLPGVPTFRLAAGGGRLAPMIDAANRAVGAHRDALLAVLPRCRAPAHVAPAAAGRRAFAAPDHPAVGPSGSDRGAEIARCCAIPDCPGTALGWD